jgi:hypothetical protein
MGATFAHRSIVTLVAAGAVAALAVVGAPLAIGSGAAGWITISSSNVGTTGTTPSIARFGKTYQVIWVERTSASSWAIRSRILNAAGKPTGSQITPLSGWAGVALDPTILAGTTAQRMIAFGGDQTSTSGPYDSDAEYLLTSTDGKTWSLASGSLSAADDATNGSPAVVNDSGTLITGLAKQDGVVYHVGYSTANPAAGPDPVTSTTGNFSGDPGLGIDTKSHQVWALWYSDSGINGQDGVNAQMIYPTVGTRSHAPDSSDPQTKSAGVQQDLSAAARTTGGIYTAYRTPDSFAAAVWKVGASKPVAVVKDKKWGVSNIVLTPGPKGRLWLYWVDRNGWRATRSNKAATRFGPVSVAKVPKSALQNGMIAGIGSAGPLEAVATITTASNKNELVTRQFLPRLSIKAAKSVKRGGKLTATVTDAGDAVKGAKVAFDGVTAKTNKKGKATLKLGHGAATGKHAATAKVGGYASASTKVKVTS